MTAEQLAQELIGGDGERRSAAAQTLAAMGADAAPAAAVLTRFAGDEAIGDWCAAALEDMGPPTVDQLDALIPLATSATEATAYWAATLLGRLGPEAAGAAETLAQAATGHAAISVRERAVWALGKIGPAAASAEPTLRALTEADSPRLARLARTALDKVAA